MWGRAPHLRVALALALGLGLCCARPAPPPPEPPVVIPPPPAPAPAPGPCLHIERLVASKRERSLAVHCAGGAVFTFPAAFGREPVGPKRASGDSRTPEGDYRIAGPARPSRFHRFIPIDYPSAADADAALAEQRISPEDHRRIVEAHRRGVMPPQDTPLGGLLGLHGEGVRWRGESKLLDWTYGCIALGDAELDFVVARVTHGTPITILPR